MPPHAVDSQPEKSVLKEARQRCHKAKDAYYKCLEENSVVSPEVATVPAACKNLRSAFEKECRPSWVNHFDTLRAKELQFIQQLHSNINRSSALARGQLAGQSEVHRAGSQTPPPRAPGASSNPAEKEGAKKG
eukprot:jgi/Botrbrau1/1739/Bobra.116_2s0079.1